MNNFERTYHLKQESPIIHFQYDVPGATLRASDVKPRLDSFINEWCKVNNLVIDKDWIIKEDAYNYKLSIELEGDCTDTKPVTAIYFGNIGKKDKSKGCCLFANKGLSLKIICFYPELLDIINNCIRTFFLINNFGSRSNRGYGSFVIKDKISEEYQDEEIKENIELIKKWYDDRSIFKIKHDISIGNEINDILMEGQLVYQILKSGYRDGKGTYKKSYLVRYFLDKNISGEKKACKNAKMVPTINNGGQCVPTDKDSYEERYISALLGYSGSLEYKEFKNMKNELFWEVINKNEKILNGWEKPTNEGEFKILCTKKPDTKLIFADVKPEYKDRKIKVNNVVDRLIVQHVNTNSLKIDRIPSPLLFKVINKEIYIIQKDINTNIGGAKFAFKVKQDINSQWKLNLSEKRLYIPKPFEIEIDNCKETNPGREEKDIKKYYTRLLDDIMCKYMDCFNKEISTEYKIERINYNSSNYSSKKDEKNKEENATFTYSLKKVENNDNGTKICKV